jgi:SPP1 gp7 family putative phage head morphogenesis protein
VTEAAASDADAIAAIFRKPPADVLAFFRKKGLKLGFAWQDVWKGEHKIAFTVAKMMDLDLLADVRSAVEKAMHDGHTGKQFAKELTPILQRAGWWGQKEQTDPQTGVTDIVQLGSARRLDTIFRTNMQTAYAAADYKQIQETKDSAPYLMYDAVDDDRTRPEHAAWSGTILPVDDPWWKDHFPPNGYNCRCSVIQLGPRDLKRMDKTVDAKAPDNGTYEYVNKRTGEVTDIPRGIDPGWDYNPGDDRAQHLDQVYAAKRKAFDANGGKVKDGGD